jgi:hypothetical protein
LATIAISGDFTSVVVGQIDRIPSLTFLNCAILFWESALEFGDREQEVVLDFLAGFWGIKSNSE